MQILNRETTTTVPYFDSVVIWTWSKNMRWGSEFNRAGPFWVCLVGVGRSGWVSSIPHSDLSIFVGRSYLISIGIKRSNNWISGQYSLDSTHFDNISNGYFMRTWGWNYLLIVDPVQGLNCAWMDDLWGKLRKRIQTQFHFFLLVLGNVMISKLAEVLRDLPDGQSALWSTSCYMHIWSWTQLNTTNASFMSIGWDEITL